MVIPFAQREKLEVDHLDLNELGLSARHPVITNVTYYGLDEGAERRLATGSFDIPSQLDHVRHPLPMIAHSHEFYEVAYICAGSALHVTENEVRPVKAGSVIIIPPGMVHTYEDVDFLVHVNVMYITEWLAEGLRFLGEQPGVIQLFLANALFRKPTYTMAPVFALPADAFNHCMSELDELNSEYNAPTPSMSLIRLCLLKTMIRIGRESVAERWADDALNPEVWYVVKNVERAIDEGRAIDVGEQAREFGVSSDYFTRVFKSATGWAPMDYYQWRRAQRAARLLLSPESSVTNVAHGLGYSDSSHLARVFRRFYEMAPRTYRKRFGVGSSEE